MEGFSPGSAPSQHKSLGLQQQEILQSLGHGQQWDEGMALAPKSAAEGGAAPVLQAPGCARQPEKGLVEKLVLLQREGQGQHHSPATAAAGV